MAKKKAAKKNEESNAEAATPEEGADECENVTPLAPPDMPPIQVDKIYPHKQFWAAVGITSPNTQKQYRNEGLRVRKPVGHNYMFVLGQDWFDFLNRPENMATELDDSDQPAPKGCFRADVEALRSEFDSVAEFANETEIVELGSAIEGIVRRLDKLEERVTHLER